MFCESEPMLADTGRAARSLTLTSGTRCVTQCNPKKSFRDRARVVYSAANTFKVAPCVTDPLNLFFPLSLIMPACKVRRQLKKFATIIRCVKRRSDPLLAARLLPSFNGGVLGTVIKVLSNRCRSRLARLVACPCC